MSSHRKPSLIHPPSGRGGATGSGSRSANVEGRSQLSDSVSFLFVGKSLGPEPSRVTDRDKSIGLFT